MKSYKPSNVRIACIGDSITYGWGMRQRHKRSYPALLQKALGPEYKVRNFGNSGKCVIKSSYDGKRRRSYFFLKEHKRALNFKPHIVLCNIGINDIMTYPETGQQLLPDYKELISQYRDLPSKPQVIVWNRLSPLFPGQTFYGSPDYDSINRDISIAIDELNLEDSKRKPVLKLNMGTALEGLGSYFFPDRLHPLFSGYKIIAATTQKFLQENCLLR